MTENIDWALLRGKGAKRGRLGRDLLDGPVLSGLGPVAWCIVCLRVYCLSANLFIDYQRSAVTKTTSSRKIKHRCYEIKGQLH